MADSWLIWPVECGARFETERQSLSVQAFETGRGKAQHLAGTGGLAEK